MGRRRMGAAYRFGVERPRWRKRGLATAPRRTRHSRTFRLSLASALARSSSEHAARARDCSRRGAIAPVPCAPWAQPKGHLVLPPGQSTLRRTRLALAWGQVWPVTLGRELQLAPGAGVKSPRAIGWTRVPAVAAGKAREEWMLRSGVTLAPRTRTPRGVSLRLKGGRGGRLSYGWRIDPSSRTVTARCAA